MISRKILKQYWKIFNYIFWPALVVIAYYVAIQMTAFCPEEVGIACGYDLSFGSVIIWWIFKIIGPIALLALPLDLAYFGYRFSDDAAGLIYVFAPLVLILILAVFNTPTYITNPLIALFPFASYFAVYYYYRESYFYLKAKRDQISD